MSTSTEQQLADLAKESLEQFMSDLSEDHYCAGWMIGLEYDLWAMVRGGPRHYGMGEVTVEDVAKLARLSEQAGGWWDGDEFLSLPDWRKEYARWFVEHHIPSLRNYIPWAEAEVGKETRGLRTMTDADVERAKKNLADAEAQVEAVRREALPAAPAGGTPAPAGDEGRQQQGQKP